MVWIYPILAPPSGILCGGAPSLDGDLPELSSQSRGEVAAVLHPAQAMRRWPRSLPCDRRRDCRKVQRIRDILIGLLCLRWIENKTPKS